MSYITGILAWALKGLMRVLAWISRFMAVRSSVKGVAGGRAGFTLAEVLLVAVILGAMAFTVSFVVSNAREGSERAVALARVQQVNAAIGAFRIENRHAAQLWALNPDDRWTMIAPFLGPNGANTLPNNYSITLPAFITGRAALVYNGTEIFYD